MLTIGLVCILVCFSIVGVFLHVKISREQEIDENFREFLGRKLL